MAYGQWVYALFAWTVSAQRLAAALHTQPCVCPMNQRNTCLDQIKAVACLLIVGHHLAFYGPMSSVVQPIIPGVMFWFEEYARMAVQVFLVLGGYLAAGALAPQGVGKHVQFWPVLGKRYVRLCIPYCAALAFALVVNDTVQTLGFRHDSVSATPSLDSLVAHVLLLHSLGNWESISAGIWYVAIDFQLYALCLMWFWLCRQHTERAWIGQAGLGVATALSLWVWNLNTDLDIWALYFLGAYGLGAMAWWATHSAGRSQRTLWVLVMALLGASALMLEWRTRIAVALVTALVLAIGGNVRWSQAWRHWDCRPLSWVGERSYSIFLIHFPVSLLVNAEVTRNWPHSITANALGMVLAVVLSIKAGAVMYEWTERTSITWQRLRQWQMGALGTGLLATLSNLF